MVYTSATTSSAGSCSYPYCVIAQWVYFSSVTGGVCFCELGCSYCNTAVSERCMALRLGGSTAICLKWSNSAWDGQPFAWEGYLWK